MSDTVIKVENISKQYRLGDVGTGALAHDLNKWWHKVRGKENPYLKIGEANDRATKGESDYVWALKDINFDVKQGEVLGIIGRNGAGKSTLLKILSKTTTPTTGSIKIKGRIASLLEVGTGFHPELSGRENIFLNGAILGMTKQEIKSKFDEIVDFAGVERYIDTPVKRYSSGMYVRLAFGVAAHLEPEILIVDEVLAVGDAEFQKKALGKMKDVSNKDGRTVLFVSHQMGAVTKLCDKALVLNKGTVYFEGTAINAVDNYINNFGNVNQTKYVSKKENDIMFIKEISTIGENDEERSEFSFTNKIRLKINCQLTKVVLGAKIGIALLDKNGNRVFSDYCQIDYDKFLKEDLNLFEFTATLPHKLFAPNQYSFLVALLIEGRIFDLVEECCSIRITDNGTELGLHEGYDYGNILINCFWDTKYA
jgi:lipopolysaccharide transport system ATP-binding protein